LPDKPPVVATIVTTAPRPVGSVSAKVVSLEDVVERVVGTVDEDLRQWLVPRVVWMFIVGNLLIMAALGVLVWLDQTNLERSLVTPAERIITQPVIMTFLGATTVQLGTVIGLIASYLFPGRRGRG
jgi:hypothetical protein